MAHQMAMVSENITSDVIEANEFPDLSRKYAVQAVPKIVINDRVEFTGAFPEPRFLAEVLRALSPKEE
jgi:hypothetical protein